MHENGRAREFVRKITALRRLAPWAALVPSGFAATLAAAQVPTTADATKIDVTLSSFRFDPDEIVLVHGHRYVLHFVNASSGGHDFVAKDFFSAATIAPDERQKVGKGEVELKGNAQADVVVTAPAPGTYEFHCSHFMHESFGMKGRIVVQ